MRKGFIFNMNRCVGCGACDAACILENGWNYHPRTIYKFKHEPVSPLQVINLSMACNHCEKPACLNSCPVNAYSRDLKTGAIIINEKKCIGCNYCNWNCPYDAPKSNAFTRLIGKCNLCINLISSGENPACASACPTGALEFADIPGKTDNSWLFVFPEKNLNPAILIPEEKKNAPLRIIPEEIFETVNNDNTPPEKSILKDWSLILFTFLATLSVSFTGVSLLTEGFRSLHISLLLIILAGLFSFFHLGKKLMAWRALNNLLKSPLSREILFFLLYLLLLFLTFISSGNGLRIASLITGGLLLIAIDSVYAIPDYRKMFYFHSGQTFVSGLLILSFFSGMKSAFVFLAIIKLIAGMYNLPDYRNDHYQFFIRFFRLALLLITGLWLISGISYKDTVVSILFITGELADRILFYYDFSPLNINTINTSQLTIKGNEKKRY